MQKYQKVSVKGGEVFYFLDYCFQFFIDFELNLVQQLKFICNFFSRNCWIFFFKEKKKKYLFRYLILVFQNEDGSGYRFSVSFRFQLVKQSQKKFKYLLCNDRVIICGMFIRVVFKLVNMFCYFGVQNSNKRLGLLVLLFV